VYTVLIGEFGGKRHIGISRRTVRIALKMDKKEGGLDDADRIHVAEETQQWWADANKGMNRIKSEKWEGISWLRAQKLRPAETMQIRTRLFNFSLTKPKYAAEAVQPVFHQSMRDS
jgi:hypothetical protein